MMHSRHLAIVHSCHWRSCIVEATGDHAQRVCQLEAIFVTTSFGSTMFSQGTKDQSPKEVQ